MKHQIKTAPISHKELMENYVVILGGVYRVIKTYPQQKLGKLGTVDICGGRGDRPCVRFWLGTGKNRRKVLASHVVWFYYTGEWPSEQIDHISGDTLDNHIDNLRLVTDLEHARISAAKRKPKHVTRHLMET